MRYLNWFLLLCSAFSGIGIIAAVNMREHYEEISREIYPESSLLMNSIFADVLVRPGWSFVVIIFFGVLIYYEFRVRSLGARLIKNMGALLLFAVTAFGVVYALAP